MEQVESKTPRVVAIASGKGGVGKSLLAANVAVFLATLSKRVVAVDASFGACNLHRLVGVERPTGGMAGVMSQRERPIDDVLEPTSVPGLQLLSSHGDPLWCANPRPGHVRRLAEAVFELDADFVVLDLASGTSPSALELAAQADLAAVISTPESTSTEMTYQWFRSLVLRDVLGGKYQREMAELIEEHFDVALPPPLDLLRVADTHAAELASDIRRAMAAVSLGIVIGCVRSKADMDLGPAMTIAAQRRLGLPVRYLGHLDYDDAVWVSLRRRRPLLIEHPESRISRCIEKVTRRLMGKATIPTIEELEAERNLYDELEVEPGASDEEIRRSMRRLRNVYSAGSPVTAGLYSGSDVEALQVGFERAYDTLLDPAKRKAYDQQLFPDGVPVQVVEATATRPTVAVPPESRPPMPAIDDQTRYTGALMRQVREARGLELREISEFTKISLSYLEDIEHERFAKLPAPVYVRGFLTQYAKMLGLDVDQVIDSYLSRVPAV